MMRGLYVLSGFLLSLVLACVQSERYLLAVAFFALSFMAYFTAYNLEKDR